MRIESKEQLFFVTSRTIDSVFWLHPLLCSSLEPVNRAARRVVEAKRARLDTRLARLVDRANKRRPPWQPQLTFDDAKLLTKNLISSALARAQQKCEQDGFEAPQVFAVIVMSNHVHLVARAPGENLAKFVGYFKARITNAVNLLLGRTGNLWQRRYDAQAILSDEAAVDRVRYTLSNPQKARLVRRLDEWPGFVALAGTTTGAKLCTEWFDWTAWHRSRCPQDKTPFKRKSELIAHKLPALQEQSDRNYVRDILDSIEPLPESERVLGLDKLLDTDIDGRPSRPKRVRRPYAFGDAAAVRAYFEHCRLVYAAYAQCSERYRQGEAVHAWPAGTYAPGIANAA